MVVWMYDNYSLFRLKHFSFISNLAANIILYNSERNKTPMNKFFLSLLVVILFFLTGCLTYHKISYDINLEGPKNGTTTVTLFDIRSDAETNKDFEADKDSLFNSYLKSDDFLKRMLDRGWNIVSRELYLDGKKLNGKVVFKFNDVKDVEGIVFDEGFYYFTMEIDDSVISTNGEVITSKDHKRIIWDKNFKTLKFEMLVNSYEDKGYRELAPFYKPE